MTTESGTAAPESARVAELSGRLRELLARIDAACRLAGRDPGEVELLPVTKYFPATDVEILYGLGRREFGESREQEAAAKVARLHGLSGIRWQMIGRLQRNKTKSVARWADTVHSVDSERLAAALDGAAGAARAAGDRDGPLRVLVQVALDGDPDRGGVAPDLLPALADRLATAEHLQLGGLMGIPPKDADPEPAFARLAALHARLRADHPEATELSAGMSADLETAIGYGSTHVRVGTALLGTRPITCR